MIGVEVVARFKTGLLLTDADPVERLGPGVGAAPGRLEEIVVGV